MQQAFFIYCSDNNFNPLIRSPKKNMPLGLLLVNSDDLKFKKYLLWFLCKVEHYRKQLKTTEE